MLKRGDLSNKHSERVVRTATKTGTQGIHNRRRGIRKTTHRTMKMQRLQKVVVPPIVQVLDKHPKGKANSQVVMGILKTVTTLLSLHSCSSNEQANKCCGPERTGMLCLPLQHERAVMVRKKGVQGNILIRRGPRNGLLASPLASAMRVRQQYDQDFQCSLLHQDLPPLVRNLKGLICIHSQVVLHELVNRCDLHGIHRISKWWPGGIRIRESRWDITSR